MIKLFSLKQQQKKDGEATPTSTTPAPKKSPAQLRIMKGKMIMGTLLLIIQSCGVLYFNH